MSAFSRLLLTAYGLAALLAAGDGYAQGSQGENFSAKPPAVLFNSDCTGSGCHNGPQGLAKGKSAGDLTSYLREHYTNSRQSAAALASYLAGVPGANTARAPRSGGEGSVREIPAREIPRPPARVEPQREESDSIFSLLPSFPFFSSSPPEEAKRDEPPARPRTRTGRRDEGAPAPRTPTTRRDDVVRPAGEIEGAKPARSRSRQPSHQLPKIEDPNTPSVDEIYRPARSRQPPEPSQQPLSENLSMPAESAVTSAPNNLPASATENAPPTTSTITPGAPPTPPAQATRARARGPAAAATMSVTQAASTPAPPKPPAVPREPIFD